MARRIVLSDDLTGNEGEDVETYHYMINNVFYEIDLSEKSFEAFEKAIGRFVKVSRETRRITATAKGEAGKAERIRQWAKANGFEVSERGRMSADIMEKYEKAQQGTNGDETDTPGNDSDSDE
jgi:hypothetical protein